MHFFFPLMKGQSETIARYFGTPGPQLIIGKCTENVSIGVCGKPNLLGVYVWTSLNICSVVLLVPGSSPGGWYNKRNFWSDSYVVFGLHFLWGLYYAAATGMILPL